MRESVFSKESRESKKSSESIRSNPSNPSILSKAGIVIAALLAAVSVQAGSGLGQSAAFHVDTRAAANVRVTGVTSRWCDGPYGGTGRHVYFLAGAGFPVVGSLPPVASMQIVFEAYPDWGGREPGWLEFNGENNGTNRVKAVNVAAFGAGGKLEVVAVAADGTRSLPFRANFDVVQLTPFPPFDFLLFYPNTPFEQNGIGPIQSPQTLSYTTPKLSLPLLGDGISGIAKGCPLPFETMDIVPKINLSAKFSGDGILTVGIGGDADEKTNINGSARKIGEPGSRQNLDGKFGKFAGIDFGLGIEGELSAAWDQPSGSWRVISGLYGLSLHGKYSTAPYYIYAPPPIYLRGYVSADAKFYLRVRDLGNGDGWKYDLVIKSDDLLKVKGVLGCGVGGIVAVEGYASLGVIVDIDCSVEQPINLNKFGVGGKVGAQLVLIGYATAPIDIWSGKVWILNKDLNIYPWAVLQQSLLLEQPLVPNLTALDTRSFQPLSRDYLKRRGTLSLALAATPAARILAATGGTETTLVTDGYPYPEPTVAAAGTTNHVLYVRDNEGRLAENRTELVDVFSAGDGWSAAAPVWDDGTGDFAPQGASLPDGTVLVAWANGRAALTNGASLDEALAGLEIAAGERDPATGVWTCRNLTANSYLDHSPALSAAADGSAMVAWIRNRDQNPTGTPDEPNRILFSQRRGGAWSEEDYVAVNLGTITYLDLAYNGAQAALVFAMDGDGDLATQGDQELYGCTFNGSQWGPYVRLTDDAVQDTRPYVRYQADGSLLVVWYRDGKIVSAKGLALADQAVAGEVGIGSAAQDFKLMTGPDGQLAVVWQDAGATGVAAPDPYILNYDPKQGVWSKGVRLLEDASLERGFSGAFGADGRLCLAYTKVAVGEDTNGVPVLGSADLCVLSHAVGPDPAVADNGVTLSTNSAAFGESVGVNVVVENRGDLPVTNLAVCVYEGDPQADGTLLGATQRVSQVLGGTSEVVTVAWTLPEAASNVTLYAVVDPGLETDDRNRANNVGTLAVLMPDLAVEGASAMNETTNVRLIRASVMNEGAVPVAAGTPVTFRRGASDGELLATDTLGVLVYGTNGVYDAGFRWDMSGTTFTSAFEVVYIAVDPTNGVGEIEEANNATAVQVMTSLDSDGDGLLDGEEQRLGTRTDLADSDGDGLSDSDEVRTYGTNPLLKDSDGDGSDDAQEVAAGTDPNSATDVFKIVAADGSESAVMSVTWNAKSGGVYRVEAAQAVTGPWATAPDSAEFFGASLQTAVSNGILRYCDFQTGQTNRFYRVMKVGP